MLENQIYSKPATRSQKLFSQLENIARKTKLIVRKSPRFSASDFVLTLFKTIATGKASYNQMASTLKKCTDKPMSRQALSQRIGERSVAFMKEALATTMQEQWGSDQVLRTTHFGRVLIEDSSQYKINKKNNLDFPGHGNSKSASAGCKIDLSFDLLTGLPIHQVMDKATTQDKVLGKELVDMVRPNDLVLRDMGYFSVKEFMRIAEKGAYWQSRLPANVGVFMEDGQSLEDHLKSYKANKLDTTVNLLSKKGEIVRLVAIRAEPHIAEKKRRERKAASRKKGKTPTAKALLRDGWHLMVTNVSEEQLDTETLAKLYAVRWQIEITFRAWKQSGELLKALNRKSKPAHLRTLIYAAILWLVLTMKTASMLQNIIAKAKKVVSLEKLSMDMIGHVLTLTVISDLSEYSPYLRHVLMEARKREPLMATGIACLS